MVFDWEKAWREEADNHPRKVTNRNRDLWNDYWDKISWGYQTEDIKKSGFNNGIIAFLLREGFLNKGDSVLDIGCGPGTFSIPIAEHAAKVTALDSSKGMLERCMEESKKRSIRTIVPVNTTWEAYVSSDPFDLVFSSLSPAIRLPGDLLRMETLSKRSCALIMFAGKNRGTGFETDLWKEVIGISRSSDAFNIRYPFNILYEWGRLPNLRMFPYSFTRETPSATAMDELLSYCSIFMPMGEEKRAALSRLIEQYSKNGMLQRDSIGVLGLLFWHVDGPGQSLA